MASTQFQLRIRWHTRSTMPVSVEKVSVTNRQSEPDAWDSVTQSLRTKERPEAI
jgi:hypothetical protein